MSILAELKRRNVVRVGIFYAVSAWLLIQVADVLVGLLALPDWTLRLVGLLLLLGLPVVLAFSWIYELTPEGIQRDRGEAVDAAYSAGTAQKLNVATIAVAAVAIALVAWQQFERTGSAPTSKPSSARSETGSVSVSPGSETGSVSVSPVETYTDPIVAAPEESPTVAVLPFANLSADAENQYFADGVAEEVLNLISRSEGLRVISRSSAFSFKGQSVPIPEVAASLGASHVLEGSIRRAGDRVRVTAQLIDAADDVHLWSETFDRELTDIFAVQDEIAAAIADALAVELVGSASRPMAIDVYDLVLEARALASRRDDEEGLRRGVELLRDATRFAPENAEAWGQLALAQMLLANWFELDARSLALTGAYATEALKLDPENVSALTALGTWQLFSLEFEAAEVSFRNALAINPNSVDAANWFGDFLYITNRLDEALEWEERAARLDPLLAVHRLNLGFVYTQLGDVDRAATAYEEALAIDPSFESALANLARTLIGARDLERFRRFAAGYDGPLRPEIEEYLTLADLIEAERMADAEALARRQFEAQMKRIWMLRTLHGDRSPEAWDLLAERLARDDRGYTYYLWPNVAPTNPQILAQSEAYAAFWREPPRDKVLKIRGHWIGSDR